MINPDDLTKRYYKIGEVAKMFDVATSLIRYWEEEFPILSPQKSNSGIRKFSKEDVLIIDKIYELVKVQGFKLKGAKIALRKSDKPKKNESESSHIQNLKNLKNELLELREEIITIKNSIRSK